MIVQRFLAWASTAPAAQRAEGAGALARAFLYSDLDTADRKAAEAALTMLLDDQSIVVRRSIAEAFASSPFAPRHIIATLAYDAPEAAIPVLMLSPILRDCDLIGLLPIRGEEEQAAIAARGKVSMAVAAAIAEIGQPMACAVLVRNPKADIRRHAFTRLQQRHGDDPAVRDALLEREDLPIAERQQLMMKLAVRLGQTAISQFRLDEERVRRMTEDACERATLALVESLPAAVVPLVRHLRESGQLTTGLVMRALLMGEMEFVEAAFAELTNIEIARVRVLLQDPMRAGFRALYQNAGFPMQVYAAFREALEAWLDLRDCGVTGAAARCHVAERALAKSEAGEIGGPGALLNRLAAEAAREQAILALKPLAPRLKAA